MRLLVLGGIAGPLLISLVATVAAPERASAAALLEIAGRVAQRIAVRSFASLPILD